MHGKETSPITDDGSNEERITLKEQEVDVNKRTVAKEAVSVGKKTVTDQETVKADLKDENIVVDRNADSKKNRR